MVLVLVLVVEEIDGIEPGDESRQQQQRMWTSTAKSDGKGIPDLRQWQDERIKYCCHVTVRYRGCHEVT